MVVLAILISSGIGYFWREQEVDKLRDELGDVKSSMGMPIDVVGSPGKPYRRIR